MNKRFVGAWLLAGFETRQADGTVTRPWGDDAGRGIICWDASGYMSAQLGPNDSSVAPYIAYFGRLEAPDVERGTLIHHVEGASTERLLAPQSRDFHFVDTDTLTLQPPAAPNGAVSTLTWKRVH
jgi:hypothetical protein